MQRPIDHLVLPSRDLAAQADFLRKIGFTVGGRNRHPWGTENHIVQFANKTFLEPVTIGNEPSFAPVTPDQFSFGGFISDFLKNREGMAMLVLRSEDAKADHAEFAEKGIGWGEPFFFERKGTRPDGAPIHVAVTLAFAHDPMAPACGFFTCQQHFPEAFWNEAAQRHANTAIGVTRVVMVSDDPRAHDDFRADFGATSALAILTSAQALPDYGPGALPFHRGPHFAAFDVAVSDLRAVAAILHANAVPHRADSDAVVIPADAAFGCAIRFFAST